MGLIRDLLNLDRKTDQHLEMKEFPFSGTDSSGMPLVSFTPALVDAIVGYNGEAIDFSNLYTTQSSVYTVVEFLAWQVAQIGLKVYRRVSDTDRKELSSDPLSRLLDRPAPGLTYERLMHGTMADLGIFGNAYWLKQEVGNERNLVPLPPFSVVPRGGSLVQAAEYRVSLGNVQRTFDRTEIVHFRRYNPADARVGISPLQPLRAILSEEAVATAHRRGFWANAARMEGVLLRPKDAGQWKENQRERFRTDWQNLYSGSNNAGKTAILEDGMTWQQASFSPKDSEFLEGRKLTLETVARAYNIPLTVLGLTDTATFASQKEFHRALYQDTLGPWLKMLQGEIMAGVLSWFTDDPKVYVEFNLAEKLRGSFEEQADAVRAYGGVPIMSINELRKLFNLPAIAEDWADIPVQPANVIYGGAGSPGIAPMPAVRAAEVLPFAKAQGDDS